MANTEGMSDERMTSLLTPDPTPKKKKSAFALQQERMRQRMQEPMGERPAATVIRASPRTPNGKSKTGTTDTVSNSVENGVQADEQQTPSDETKLAPPIMGAVVERSVSNCSNRTSHQHVAKKKSRFASLRQQHDGGFPSLKMPVGTFVEKKNGSEKSAAPPIPRQQVQSTTTRQDDSIQRDSEALLAQMSPNEIREEVQELKSTLSPEMIAFLKKRGKQKARDGAGSCPTTARNDRTEKDVPKPPVSMSETKNDDREEKERIASLLSSVRTPEELDAVYAQEVGNQTTNDEIDETKEPSENDWDTAINLLRSTSPRQAMWAARVVCERLETDMKDGKSCSVDGPNSSSWPYPTVLPVSLRCLLDSPVSQSNGYLLHTYVLRSLYALLQLRAHSSHVVNVSSDAAQTAASVFQQYFMDDGVPSPPFGTCYPPISVQPVATSNGGDAVAYSTSSSSTSAQQDGEAFAKDPMWTLLTRMRILPRLAELLSVGEVPDEAIIAMCGILSMLSVRSVGTASAIAEHPSILASLLNVTLLPSADNDSQSRGIFNTRVALPAIIFLCTLARQSRIGAAAIPVSDILPPILAVSAETNDEHTLQQWCLILWRTILRYGLGLSSLSTMISLSIPHLATERSSLYSLSANFLGAFSNVCYCARVAASIPERELRRLVSEEDCEVLATATEWLATTARQTIRDIKNVDKMSISSIQGKLGTVGARLRFLHSYFSTLFEESGRDRNDSSIDWPEVVLALQQVSSCKLLEEALSMIPTNGYAQLTVDAGDDSWVELVSQQQEASACAFVDALASLLHSVSVSEFIPSLGVGEELWQTIATAMSKFRTVFIAWMNKAEAASTPLLQPMPRPRRGWLNATNFHVSRFVQAATGDISASDSDLETIRSHVFSLIGRLELGEEAFAAMLFSNDKLFRTNDESNGAASSLPSFLMRELCATLRSRQQLDHSFKLHYGFGITSNEWGPFEIGTLLSETDSQDARPLGPFADLLLPMGPLWLWKLLSGITNQVESEDNADETTILVSCLELLLHLETQTSLTANAYAAQAPDGAKLYYIMNVFLHSESVLRDYRISQLVDSLFAFYTAKIGSKDLAAGSKLAESFWQACSDHSQISHPEQSNDVNRMETKDDKLLSVFLGERGVSEKQLRPLIDFVADISKVYLEYGAQYDIFTKCIRLFLSAIFTSPVRCEAIRSLREILHLLTLPEESSNPDGLEMQRALNLCLQSDADESGIHFRDSSEFLDLIASVLKDDDTNESAGGEKWEGSFFFPFAVASLARSLVLTDGEDVPFENANKKRLLLLSKKSMYMTMDVACQLRSQSGDEDLVSVVCDVVNSSYGRTPIDG